MELRNNGRPIQVPRDAMETPAYAQLHSIQDLYRLHYFEELSCYFVWKSNLELFQCVVTGWVH